MVGVLVLESVLEPGTTADSSCEISMVTNPEGLTRGITCRITPVSRYSMEFMIGEPGDVVSCCSCVVIGTWSPTFMVAGWFSSTTIEGEETTRTVVTSDKASRTRRGSDVLPRMRLRPGKLGLRITPLPLTMPPFELPLLKY